MPDWDGAALMEHLGGTVKLGNILHEASLSDPLPEHIVEAILAMDLPPKILFGLTVYGGSTTQQRRIERSAREVKKILTAAGRSARWVTSEGDEPLSPAAIAKLRMTTDGADIVLCISGERVFIGRTTHVQDADAWSLRDFGRPVRDDENGMLPPKLARMMVNMAAANGAQTLLDPFCGSGTVLMEAALATRIPTIIGTDNDPAQINGSNRNIAWLLDKGILPGTTHERFDVRVTDARGLSRLSPPLPTIDAVVTEGYLGPPLRGFETQDQLSRTAHEITELWEDTLIDLYPLLRPGARLVCAWPAFKTDKGLARVDLTEDIAEDGHYRMVHPLAHIEEKDSPLLYHRAGQRVMRRIAILERT